MFINRKDIALGSIIIGLPLYIAVAALIFQGFTIFFYAILFILVVVIWLWFRTDYKIVDHFLLVYIGFRRKKFDIMDIKGIEELNSLSSVDSYCIDRLDLEFEESHVVISTIHKEELIQQLRDVNNKITIDTI